MRNPPLFSIILPTFDAESKLAASLASVLDEAQDFGAVEVLVMDGASRDGTVAIAREWSARDPRIQVWSEPDKGVYDAMNKGIARATGEFLYFLGAGDLMRPGALGFIADQLPPRGEKLRFIYGDMALPEGEIFDGPYTLSKIRTQNIGHQAIFYERGIFDLLGGYDLTYPVFADHVFNQRCFGASQIEPHYLPCIVADYESGGLSCFGDEAYLRDRLKNVRRFLGLRQWGLALLARVTPSFLKEWLRLRGRRAHAQKPRIGGLS